MFCASYCIRVHSPIKNSSVIHSFRYVISYESMFIFCALDRSAILAHSRLGINVGKQIPRGYSKFLSTIICFYFWCYLRSCSISLAPVLICIYCWVIIFVFLLFISWFIHVCTKWCIDKLGIFNMNQTYLCVLVHFRISGEVGTIKHVKAIQWILQTVPRQCVFLWIFNVVCAFTFVFIILFVCPLQLCVNYWERADLLALLCVMFTFVF